MVNASHLVSEKQLCGTICVEHILGWGWGFAVNTPEMTQGLRTFEWKWRRPRISKSTNRPLSHGGTRYKTNNQETTGHIFGMHRHQFAEMTLPLHRSLREALQGHVWLASTPCARTHRYPAGDVEDQGKEREEQLDPKAAKPLLQIFRQCHHLHKRQSRSLSDSKWSERSPDAPSSRCLCHRDAVRGWR